jgi:hypothetical protein
MVDSWTRVLLRSRWSCLVGYLNYGWRWIDQTCYRLTAVNLLMTPTGLLISLDIRTKMSDQAVTNSWGMTHLKKLHDGDELELSFLTQKQEVESRD